MCEGTGEVGIDPIGDGSEEDVEEEEEEEEERYRSWTMLPTAWATACSVRVQAGSTAGKRRPIGVAD